MNRAQVHARDPAALLEEIAGAGFQSWGSSREGRAIYGARWAGAAAEDEQAEAPRADARAGAEIRGGPRRLLIVGAVHGDEPASGEAVFELAARIGPASLVAGGRIVLLPVLNPDGLVSSRKNSARDVDLNRNFPARNFTRAHEPGYDPGPAPLSEPESAVLAEVVAREAVDAIVAVHAPFACVNFDGPAAAWAEAVAAACGWPVRPNIGYPTPGSLGSWWGIDRGLPILTLELPPGAHGAFRASAAAALDAAISHLGLFG